LKLRILVALAVLALVLPPQAVRSQNLLSGLAIDGVRCEANEGAAEHIHTHLQLFDRSKAQTVPAGIGIPPGAGCLYWLHTHSADGIIHIESPVNRMFTLGQFFDIWDVDLSTTRAAGLQGRSGKRLRVTVNGKPWTGDPRAIPLRDREEIVIQSGPPFTSGRHADWSNL
jgi:hypothetical protein